MLFQYNVDSVGNIAGDSVRGHGSSTEVVLRVTVRVTVYETVLVAVWVAVQ